jgi:hypothetical protein
LGKTEPNLATKATTFPTTTLLTFLADDKISMKKWPIEDSHANDQFNCSEALKVPNAALNVPSRNSLLRRCKVFDEQPIFRRPDDMCFGGANLAKWRG